MKYLVIEVQTNADGKVSNLVFAYDSQLEAESKFHAVLSAAAISALPVHSCALMSNDCVLLKQGCYKHETIEEVTTEA
jgi:hypothetical protein